MPRQKTGPGARCIPIMRIMGVDPGIAQTGYGIIDASANGNRLGYVASGVIATPPRVAFVERLSRIYEEVDAIIRRYRPSCLAIEDVFFAKNPRAALLLGHARGVVLLSAARCGVPVYAYSATAIKAALCRFGSASKRQVTSMAAVLLGARGRLSTHAADALAAGICHAHTQGFAARLSIKDTPCRGPAAPARVPLAPDKKVSRS